MNYLPKTISKKLAKTGAYKINSIVTSLNGPKKYTNFYNHKLLNEYAIPALMPGQHIAFGFMKNSNSMDISIVMDKILSVDTNEKYHQSMHIINKILA